MPRPDHLIAVSAASFAKNATLVAELKQLGVPIRLNTSGRVLGGSDLSSCLSGATIAIVGTEVIDRTLLSACPELSYVAKYGVGLDNLDLPLLAERGIAVGWTGGVNRRSVSELVLAFALGHFHRVNAAVAEMRQGRWVKDGGRQLTDLSVGIVGLGHVGSDLAQLLKAFGPRILYHDIIDKTAEAAALGITSASLNHLIAHCDLITFHVPATELTKNMFGLEQIKLAQPHALIINTSRGQVVDVATTCQAVASGRLGGFAADVFPQEPADMSAWSHCDRLYFTPHIGGNTAEAVLAMGRSAIAAVRTFLHTGPGASTSNSPT